MVRPVAIALALLATTVALSEAYRHPACVENCSFTNSTHCCIMYDQYKTKQCFCNSPQYGNFTLEGSEEGVTSIK